MTLYERQQEALNSLTDDERALHEFEMMVVESMKDYDRYGRETKKVAQRRKTVLKQLYKQFGIDVERYEKVHELF